MVYTGSLLLLLSPLTPLHAGTGRSGGIVDLPVQRDNLGFPIIYASSLKGAIKTHVFLRDNELAKKLFGPEPDDEGEKYASPVSLTDAFPLLVPARSAKGNPVMATSGFMARRGLDLIELAFATGVKDETVLEEIKSALQTIVEASKMIGGSEETGNGKAVVFSEAPIVETGGKNKIVVCGELLEAIVKKTGGEEWKHLKEALPEAFRDAVPDRIVVLSDDDALRIIEKSMIRLTRVRLDRERKVVIEGGLWTEEYLPHGTLLLSIILYSKHRASAANLGIKDNDKLRNRVIEAIGIKNRCGYLVFGGKESVGKGITRACIL